MEALDSRGESSSKLIKILIPAVGGQGGGVLTEWLVQSFQLDGYDVQGIGLPGLSQRGGSTTYYLEAHPAPQGDEAGVIFSQYPVPGDVDLILAQEFLELGRVLEEGYGSAEKTIIVASTHRIYSTLEKMPVSSGIYSNENLAGLARAFSAQFIGFDALRLAKEKGMDELAVNAILLGAVAASGALPLSEASYLKAIESTGVSVANNIKAFRVGWDYVKARKHEEAEEKRRQSWEAYIGERALRLSGDKREAYREMVHLSLHSYPLHLKEILAEAIYRLIDYQGVGYAEKYLEALDDVYNIDVQTGGGFKITENFAKNYALWMTYEDGIRVAELKIKSDRFRKIRQEMRVGKDQLYRVIDYLKPDAYEIYGLLPFIIVKPFVKIFNAKPFRWLLRRKKKPLTLGQRPVTTSFFGFLRLWLITKLKFTRPWSYRYREEHRLMGKYKSAVERFTAMNPDLGLLVARSGSIIKGYGKVRRRTMKAFERFLDNVITPLANFDAKQNGNFNNTLSAGQEALQLISGSSTEGIEQAEFRAQEILKEGKAA